MIIVEDFISTKKLSKKSFYADIFYISKNHYDETVYRTIIKDSFIDILRIWKVFAASVL